MDEEKKVYIGNLDFGVTEQDLQKLFEEKGLKVKEIKIVKDRFTDRSKGFGFAEFEDSDQAQQSIDLLDGQELKSRQLKVSKARRRENRFSERRGGGGFKSYRR